MAPQLLFTTCVLGAIGLYLMLRPGRRWMHGVGALIGLGVLGWLIAYAPFLATDGGERRPEPFFVIFSAIATAAGVRMITHERPVYCALYFILVVLSSGGLFLLLLAEFMAFALVIVYAGAILITYVFVLMLAQQAEEQHVAPEYDRVPREPAAAVLVGFVMLALFTLMLFDEAHERPTPPAVQQVAAERWAQLEQMPVRLEEQVRDVAPDFNWPPDANAEGRLVRVDGDGIGRVVGTAGAPAEPVTIELPVEAMPENAQLVGLALVADFPVSLELAGVILLLAMFGAVVLARRQIEIGEDEVREAAGLTRFDFHEDEPDATHGSAGGAS